MKELLTVDCVSKRFANHTALDNVSLAVPEGSVYGLLGPNGAGKTTLIRIINHITLPDSGTVTFDGHPLSDADLVNIGYLPEERGLYKKMKVGEQAIFFTRLKGMSRNEATRELRHWFEKFEIMDWWNRKVEELSKGMAQKVQFIVTVLHRPKLLIFDEPFSGFDPINANLLKDEIMQLRKDGATIIFSTHNMASVEEICDNITLINDGHNILSGNVDTIRREFARGRYEFVLDGEPSQQLKAKLAPMTVSVGVEREDPSAREVTMRVELKDPDAVKPLVAAVNEGASILSFREAMSSMNDIFINSVKHYNENKQ